jgi:hypothetical protein
MAAAQYAQAFTRERDFMTARFAAHISGAPGPDTRTL